MCPYQYYHIMRNCKDKRHYRYQIVTYAEKHGIKPAARFFHTTSDTVRKWFYRFKESGYPALEDISRRPHHSPNETPENTKQLLVDLKSKYKRIGAEQIKTLEDILVSPKTMRKIWREKGVSSRQRRKKYITKNNLRERKKQFNLFQHTCEDTKELKDIPEYWTQMMKLGLPRIQYTYREVSCGIMYLAYADELSLTYATLFSNYIQNNLIALGIDLSETTRQTDNGSEYIGAWNAKEPSSFTLSVESIPGQRHVTIPPAHHRWQADVETVHDIIERELFEIETFSDNPDFFNKVFSYQLFFNMVRPNTYKENKSPWQLAQEKIPNIRKEVLMIPTVDLRWLLKKKMDFSATGVYDVSSGPYIRRALKKSISASLRANEVSEAISKKRLLRRRFAPPRNDRFMLYSSYPLLTHRLRNSIGRITNPFLRRYFYFFLLLPKLLL